MCILVLFLVLHPTVRYEKYKELQVEGLLSDPKKNRSNCISGKLFSLRTILGKIFRTINISDLFPMTILYFKVSQEALNVECKLVLSTK